MDSGWWWRRWFDSQLYNLERPFRDALGGDLEGSPAPFRFVNIYIRVSGVTDAVMFEYILFLCMSALAVMHAN